MPQIKIKFFKKCCCFNSPKSTRWCIPATRARKQYSCGCRVRGFLLCPISASLLCQLQGWVKSSFPSRNFEEDRDPNICKTVGAFHESVARGGTMFCLIHVSLLSRAWALCWLRFDFQPCLFLRSFLLLPHWPLKHWPLGCPDCQMHPAELQYWSQLTALGYNFLFFLVTDITTQILFFIVVQVQLSPFSPHHSPLPSPPPPPILNPTPLWLKDSPMGPLLTFLDNLSTPFLGQSLDSSAI